MVSYGQYQLQGNDIDGIEAQSCHRTAALGYLATEVLPLEYKGKDRWGDAKDDSDIGALWEELSGVTCLFLTATDRNWVPIKEMMGS